MKIIQTRGKMRDKARVTSSQIITVVLLCVPFFFLMEVAEGSNHETFEFGENIDGESCKSIKKKETIICGYHVDNNFILTVSAFSFALFVAAEIIGALASGSLSLLGDAGAMSVDVFTVLSLAFSHSTHSPPHHSVLLQHVFGICQEEVRTIG
jgi:hypothetical protein